MTGFIIAHLARALYNFLVPAKLRGQAQQRQVNGARVALQHNLGLGGACVVTLYVA